MSAASKSFIAAEFARRANQFHPGENPMEIVLWGLFSWGDVSPYIKTGEIIPNHGFTKENRTVWCKPSQAFFDKWIAPLMPPNAAGQGRRKPYPEPDCSAFDSEETEDREERCDSCGETSRCLMNGICPMCYELNGGTHD